MQSFQRLRPLRPPAQPTRFTVWRHASRTRPVSRSPPESVREAFHIALTFCSDYYDLVLGDLGVKGFHRADALKRLHSQ